LSGSPVIPWSFSDLPTENWNDIFGFLPRPQLAELVPQIGDWHFAGKALFYLHECGKIILDDFFIKPSANGNGTAIVEINKQLGREMPLADVPMPSNIKNFKRITLRFVLDDNLNAQQNIFPFARSYFDIMPICFVAYIMSKYSLN
jgi:hypothetical protein